MLGLATKEKIQLSEFLWKTVTNDGEIKFNGKDDVEIIRLGVERFVNQTKSKTVGALRGEGFISLSEAKLVERAAIFDFLAKTPDGQILLTGMTKWANNGYPQITLGHKYASALLVSNISKDVLPLIKRPWDSFILSVPSGLIQLHDNLRGVPTDVNEVLVCEVYTAGKKKNFGPKWAYLAVTAGSVSVWRFGVETEDLLPPTVEGNPYDNDPLCLKLTDRDERAMTLLGRLIINTCAAMTDRSCVNEIGPGHKAYRERKPGRLGPPVVRSFNVGQPVKLDFREHVRKYMNEGGKRGPISVQTLVAGHFKSQPHGPQNTLRKIIWRQPYWRGAEDSPINIRPHIIGDT